VTRAALVAGFLAAALVPWWATARLEPEPALWRTWAVSHFLGCAAWSLVVAALAHLALGRGALRERGLRVAAAALGLGGALAVAEAPAVVAGWDWGSALGVEADATWLDHALATNRPDPELIHVHWPHHRFEGEVVGNLAHLGIPSPPRHRVDVRYDRHGFRNERDLEQADVVLIGDSFVEGDLVAFSETVGERLAARLGQVVANLGQSAYGFEQERIVLERYGLPLRPRLVVWFLFGGNDLRDVDHYRWQREHFEELKTPRRAPLARRLLLRNGLLALSAATTPPALGPRARARSGEFRRADGVTERVYFGDTERPWKPHEWEVMTRTLEEAKRLTRGIGADFLLIYIPRKFRVYRGHVRLEEGTEAAGWSVNDLPEALGAWCRESDIAYLDTTPVLEAEVAAGRHVYFVDDVHWNAHGHAVVADAIAERLGAGRSP